MKTKIISIVLASALLTSSVQASDSGISDSLKISTGRLLCDYEHNTVGCIRELAVDIAVELAAIPTVVSIASAAGTTASTGTAVATLSGAAATSATLASIGGAATPALAAVGIVAAPAVVGGAIVLAIGGGVAWGINALFD